MDFRPVENRVYLDHAATTPLDPRVLEAMLPILQEDFGNASSVHSLGRKARYLVENARERVAKHLGAEVSEVFFTSGGTEANNAAVLGSLCHTVISNPAEHESVLQAVTKFGETGRVDNLGVGPNGLVDLDQLERECAGLDPGFLVSIMRVNNETGTRNDIRRAGDIVHAAGGYLHCDAVQAAAHERIDVDTVSVDLMSLSGHKLNGPKGVGVLYVRAGTPFRGVVVGGSQERGRRAGTENVAAIVGMAKAMDLAKAEMEDNVRHIRTLQSILFDRIQDLFGSQVIINTPNEDELRAPHIVNISFPPAHTAVDGEMILLGLDLERVCASSGSACTSGTIRPSHVLLAMGREADAAKASVRFSIGYSNTIAEIDGAADALRRVYDRVVGEETRVG